MSVDLIAPGTMSETDAINYMLSAIGEAPIVNIATATQADVAIAINILKVTLSEVLRMKWAFNTEFGYNLTPTGTLVWGDPNGVTETLNVFEVPANLATYRLSTRMQQQGPRFTDVAVRQAIYFQDPDAPGSYPMVFYDRANNREGLNQAAYPYLLIDAVWYMPFSQIPDEAQLYVVAKAARMLVERSVNAGELASFIKTDEAFAYRHLRRAWGIRDDYNMLRTVNAARFYGWRPALNAGFIDNRGMPPSIPAPVQDVDPITISNSSVTIHTGAVYPFTSNTVVFTVHNTEGTEDLWATVVITAVDGVVITTATPTPIGRIQIPKTEAVINLSFNITAAQAGSGSITISILNGSQSVIGTATNAITVAT